MQARFQLIAGTVVSAPSFLEATQLSAQPAAAARPPAPSSPCPDRRSESLRSPGSPRWKKFICRPQPVLHPVAARVADDDVPGPSPRRCSTANSVGSSRPKPVHGQLPHRTRRNRAAAPSHPRSGCARWQATRACSITAPRQAPAGSPAAHASGNRHAAVKGKGLGSRFQITRGGDHSRPLVCGFY